MICCFIDGLVKIIEIFKGCLTKKTAGIICKQLLEIRAALRINFGIATIFWNNRSCDKLGTNIRHFTNTMIKNNYNSCKTVPIFCVTNTVTLYFELS